MNKIHFKLILVLALLIQGCAIDEHSYIVRLWSDGFVYTEKKSDANQDCSIQANHTHPDLSPKDSLWREVYNKCMKKRGY